MDLEFIDEMIEQIKARKAEIEELENAAERSCHEVSTSMLPLAMENVSNMWTVARSPVSQATAS